MNDPPERDESIFEAALELPPEERAGYLDKACACDAQLREQVKAMLREHEEAGHFMADADEIAPGLTVPVFVPLTEKAGDKISHYKLLKQIGEGGCGVVYMAEQEEPIRRRVAFKVIKLGMDTKQVIARFEAERQALALMDHPNIAKVFDAGATETGRPYFVMELVHGIKITDYCDENNLSTEARLELFMQVCHAIQHAHQKGIIHRDIKPSNILVTLHDGKPVPKVIDFGIAKATEQKLTDKTLFTTFEQFIGTPAYMSPEQAKMSGLDIDTRSDIYSLGVLLYELLTGKTPFDAKELVEGGLEGMRRIIRGKEPARPSTKISTLGAEEQTTVAQRRQVEAPRLIHQVRGDLDWIVMKCIEKDRTRRYETANGLARDIESHLKHLPVSAAAPTLGYRLAKFSRRNRTVLVTFAGFVLLLVSAVVLTTWQALRANRALVVADLRTTETREALWSSYLSTARANRLSGQPGRRFATLEAASNAAAIRPSAELRSQAASALALEDVRTVWKWGGFPRGSTVIGCDARLERYARSDEQGNLSVRQVRDDREILAWRGQGQPVYFSPRFSVDGRFVAAQVGLKPRRVQVWNLDTRQPVLKDPLELDADAFDFSPAAPVVVANDSQGVAHFVDLISGRAWSWSSGSPAPNLRFRPGGKQLAMVCPEMGLRLYEVESGAQIKKVAFDHPCGLTWSPDGSRLCGNGYDGRLWIWDVSREDILERVVEAHQQRVFNASFDPQGEFLLTQSFDGTAKLWSLPSFNMVLKWPGVDSAVSFSADGRRLGPWVTGQTVQLLELARGAAFRVLSASPRRRDCGGAFSPDGRWVVVPGADGAECFDLRTWQRVWVEPLTGAPHHVLFRPDGRRVLVLDEGSAREWPWSVDSETNAPRLGAPRRLSINPPFTEAEYSRDGSVLVISQNEGLFVFDAQSPDPVILPMPMCNFAALSSDGRWAAASPWGGPDVKIWELPGGREAFHLTNGMAALGFTPDGRGLMISTSDCNEFLEVGTWRTVSRVPKERSALPGLAVSSDSRWVALRHPSHQVQLCEAPALKAILMVEADSEWPVRFSPDNSFLLTRRSTGQFCLWNLQLVREELTPLGLGW